MKKITIVIPALNEEEGIGLVLKEIPFGQLMSMGYETEVLVVDNGSTDRTRHIAKQHGAIVLVQPVRGYGNAYKAGFANASGDIIVTGDADYTYPFEDLPGMIDKMEKEELDFISTNRLEHINPEIMTPSHIFGNRIFTAITKFLFKLPIIDTQSGMWIFRREIWDELDVRSPGMAFSQELKIEAYLRGFKCAEVPIKYRIRTGVAKLNTLKDGIKVMFRIFHKRLSTLSLKNTSRRRERVSILEAAGSEAILYGHINGKNEFQLNSAQGFAADILVNESGVQERLSPPEHEVYSEKRLSEFTLKDEASKERQIVLEYLNGD
jgi:glycosyltransferase involved in cell wall biosynthesis